MVKRFAIVVNAFYNNLLALRMKPQESTNWITLKKVICSCLIRNPNHQTHLYRTCYFQSTPIHFVAGILKIYLQNYKIVR